MGSKQSIIGVLLWHPGCKTRQEEGWREVRDGWAGQERHRQEKEQKAQRQQQWSGH